MYGLYLIEVKARSGNAKHSKTVLANPNCKVKGLIKFTAQNIGQVDNKKTIPYLAFYVTSKEFISYLLVKILIYSINCKLNMFNSLSLQKKLLKYKLWFYL